MKNLAGELYADNYISEELFLAGIRAIKVQETNSEVPYTIAGKLGKWIFTRAWYYWVAKISDEDNDAGLPLDEAYKLYNKRTVSGRKLGEVVRAGGSDSGILPNYYVAQPIYNDELDEKLLALGYKKVFSKSLNKEYIDISSGEIADLCNSGKLNIDRFVNIYHIDEIVGLKMFADFLKENNLI